MPEPRSGTVSFGLPGELGVRVPVEIRDESFALVESTYAGEAIEVPAGSYVVSTVLPTGEQHAEIVEVEAGSQAEVPLMPSPAYAQQEPLPVTAVETRPPWFLRFVPADAGADAEVRDARRDREPLEVALDVRARGQRVTFAQLATLGQVPTSLALPVAAGTSSHTCELRVIVTDRVDAAISLDPVGQTNGVAEYLARGYLKAATDVVGDAEALLHGKMADPIGAALGGYALLRLGLLERMHEWPGNLAEWFPWLPDGAVIAGEHARRKEDHERALPLFELAATRGLPIFADGFSMLLARLGEYARCSTRPKGVTRERVQTAGEHGERLAALAPFVDFSSLVLSIRGADPADPVQTHRPLAAPSSSDGWRRFDLDAGGFVEI